MNTGTQQRESAAYLTCHCSDWPARRMSQTYPYAWLCAQMLIPGQGVMGGMLAAWKIISLLDLLTMKVRKRYFSCLGIHVNQRRWRRLRDFGLSGHGLLLSLSSKASWPLEARRCLYCSELYLYLVQVTPSRSVASWCLHHLLHLGLRMTNL